ncbi:tail protein D [Pseudoalteromonas luteoviolacea]|uniref:Tail protein D n=1 Tax=Pseudoalteromonas luteoviolacea TaxID=43657 RepID=A0A0C1MU19_9GAMM|nr:contractile injection system protein, VgrG/Pvc8 family [Pseudoalteromonas luteoviolacea]KID58288.1 tail protein D [Pseudoalteromonas luteoviolacea]
MELQPQYSVKANGNEVAEKLRDRIAEVSVTLRTGLLSDMCVVKFDNLEKAPITLPEPTDKLEIAMGYKQGTEDGKAPSVVLGEFEVGEYQVVGPVRALELVGNKVFWDQNLKAAKLKSWPSDPDNPLTLGSVISEIAQEYGLTPRIAPALDSITLPHIEQSESDMQLMSKLAEQHDAVMKIINDNLVFMKKGTGRSLSGQPLPQVSLEPKWIVDWKFNTLHYRLTKEVVAKYHDLDIAQLQTVSAGGGTPSLTLPYTYADEASAQHAAESKLAQLNRAHVSADMVVYGNPDIVAGAVVEVQGTQSALDKSWFVKEVRHVINGHGFLSYLQCETLSE